MRASRASRWRCIVAGSGGSDAVVGGFIVDGSGGSDGMVGVVGSGVRVVRLVGMIGDELMMGESMRLCLN